MTIITAATLLAVSCGSISEEECQQADSELTGLEISVSTDESEETRGIISKTTLPSGSVIGLYLYDDTGTRYDGWRYENVAYTATGNGSSQSWDSENRIMVSSTEGTLYGYYPYSEDVQSIGKIPVTATSEVQEDVMWAEPVSEISKDSRTVSIIMKHALSAVRLTLRRGSYTGEGRVTSASVSGSGMATGAMLDGTCGELSKISGAGTAISPAFTSFTLSEDGDDIDIIVVPSDGKGDIAVCVDIDGKTYEVAIEDVTLSQGEIAGCELTVNNGEVNVANVEVMRWTSKSAGDRVIRNDFNIYLEGDKEGLSFHNEIDEDGNVTILAVPYISKDAETKTVTIEGDAVLEQSVNDETGVLTIKLSEIASDVTVNFNGFYLWITATHEVTDISAPTELFRRTSAARIKIDGVETDNDNMHQFESAGEHVVKVAFSDYKTVPASFMNQNETVISVIIPEGVEHIGSNAFNWCKYLKTVTLPTTLKTINYYAFSGTPLESIEIHDGCILSYSLFWGCDSLSKVILPSDLKTIPSSLFYQCSSLREIEIPESVTTIESSAFSWSGLESLRFPDGISVIPQGVLSLCHSLKEVTFPPNLKVIGQGAFSLCDSLQRVILADGTICTGELLIPEGVTEMGQMAIYMNSPHFTSVSLPSTLTTILPGGLASQVTQTFSFPNGNDTYDIRNNSVIETATNRLVGSTTQSSVIHESVTIIGGMSFYESTLSSIDMHAGITLIEDNAFQYADMKTVISRAITPPQLGKTCFQLQKYSGKLKVPEEALDAYQTEWMKDEQGYIGMSDMRWSLVALAEGE